MNYIIETSLILLHTIVASSKLTLNGCLGPQNASNEAH